MGCGGSKGSVKHGAGSPSEHDDTADDSPGGQPVKFRKARDSVVVARTSKSSGYSASANSALSPDTTKFKRVPRDSIVVHKLHKAGSRAEMGPGGSAAVALPAMVEEGEGEEDEGHEEAVPFTGELAVATHGSPGFGTASPSSGMSRDKPRPSPLHVADSATEPLSTGVASPMDALETVVTPAGHSTRAADGPAARVQMLGSGGTATSSVAADSILSSPSAPPSDSPIAVDGALPLGSPLVSPLNGPGFMDEE